MGSTSGSCPSCSSTLVQPVNWHEQGGGSWNVELRCPECEWWGQDSYSQTEVDRYDEELDRGGQELIEDLREAGNRVVLASSAKQKEVDHYLDLLDARELVDDWTSSADVESTKPDPDLVQTALDKAGAGEAVMVGDSTWDCEAARRAGIETVAVLTGGHHPACVLERHGCLRGGRACHGSSSRCLLPGRSARGPLLGRDATTCWVLPLRIVL